MAERLSFVAWVIGVTSLAENVVTKGYLYLKAVKNCPDEVRSLMAESNVLCGILGRLKVLLEGNQSKIGMATKSKDGGSLSMDDNHEKDHEEGIVSSDEEGTAVSENGTRNSSFSYAMLSTAYATFKSFILPTLSMNVRKLYMKSKVSSESVGIPIFNQPKPPSAPCDSTARVFDAWKQKISSGLCASQKQCSSSKH